MAGALAALLLSIHPLPALETPSGNIRCFVTPAPNATLHCSLKQADYAGYVQKIRCGPPIGLDWAGFSLPARSTATPTCSGGILYSPETQRPRYVTVPYGHACRAGPFDCRSTLAGLRCGNHTGHGLFISRRTYRLW